MPGVTEELNQILESLDTGKAGTIQIRNFTATVKGILEREPKNPLALYVKAKLLIRSARPQDRLRIKPEVLSLVNDMTASAHSVVYYHRKFTLLNELNVHDEEVYQQQKNACLEIVKTPRNLQSEIYHRTAEGFLGRDGSRPRTPPPQPIFTPPPPQPPVQPKSVPPPITPKPTQPGVMPDADFSVDPSFGEPPLSVQFLDRSSGSPHTWNWEFGDGSTSREANPVHIYSDEGQFTVSLKIINKTGSDTVSKAGLIRVAARSSDGSDRARPSDGPDPEKIYEEAIGKMVQKYPEIVDLVLAGPHKEMQLKGYVLDAFGGETPKEFYTLMNCVDEEVPLIILENMQEKTKLNAKIETKKVSLKNKGLSSEFVDWAVEVWKLSLINENMKNGKNSTTPVHTDSDIIF